MNNERKILYTIKMFHDFTEPYLYTEDIENIIRHKNSDEYATCDKDTFHKILDEFLDAPKKKLTDKDIHHDFDSHNHILSDNKVNAIKTYYNGRYELSKKIYHKIKTIDENKIEYNCPIVLKFKIPFELNYFSCEDNDEYDNAVKMNDAGIEIEIARILK